jgi:lipid-A-disaccharide synthase
VLLAPRAAAFVASRRRLRAEVMEELGRPVSPDPSPAVTVPRDRRLRVFVACAEVSGEIHAVNVVRALKRRAMAEGAPPPMLSGWGGARLAAEGVAVRGNPVERAQMGLSVLSSVPWYARLLADAARGFRDGGCDLVLAVDSPALNVPLARIARRYGVPTVHFVTPQYWGWAPWRAKAYAKSVERALSILPFEKRWFERRGIAVAHVGHPLIDELADVKVSVPREDARELVVLPGSRSAVIERNLPWMLCVAKQVREMGREQGLEVPVVVAHDREDLTAEIREHIERADAAGFARVEIGDLHGTLARARTAFSVSGTVLLDLLHHSLPAVVVYRLARAHEAWLSRRLLTVPWFSSVNLLAGTEVYPELCFAGEGPLEEAASALWRLHSDPGARAACLDGLARARERLGPPGACDRAAAHALQVAAAGPISGRSA